MADLAKALARSELVRAAEDAINAVFSDASVSVDETIETLTDLSSDIDDKLAALRCDKDAVVD